MSTALPRWEDGAGMGGLGWGSAGGRAGWEAGGGVALGIQSSSSIPPLSNPEPPLISRVACQGSLTNSHLSCWLQILRHK